MAATAVNLITTIDSMAGDNANRDKMNANQKDHVANGQKVFEYLKKVDIPEYRH